MRFELKFFFAYSQKIDIPESVISLFSLEKSTRLFLAKEVKPFPDRKMIKLLTFGFDNFFPSLRH